MKRLTGIVLVFMMLLTLLGGCQNNAAQNSTPTPVPTIPTTAKPTTAPTTEPQQTQHDPLAVPPELTEKSISRLYYFANVNNRERNGQYYFGAFEDSYAVLFRLNSGPYDPCWETVNGLTFYYPDGYPILWVYKLSQKGDTAGHLWEMFHRKLITEEQLQEIYDNYYSAYPELLPLAQAVDHFGSDDMEAISRDLMLYTAEELGWEETNEAGRPRLVYYCTVDGKHVFRWIPDFTNSLLEYPVLYVGGCGFIFQEYLQIYVYYEEELMTLQEAYDRGLFSREQLKGLRTYHNLSDEW